MLLDTGNPRSGTLAPTVDAIYHSAEKFAKFDKLGVEVTALTSSWKYGVGQGGTLYPTLQASAGKYVPERPEPLYPASFKRGAAFGLHGETARDLSVNIQRRGFYCGSPGGMTPPGQHGPTPGTSSGTSGSAPGTTSAGLQPPAPSGATPTHTRPLHPSATSPTASAMAAAAFLRGAFPGRAGVYPSSAGHPHHPHHPGHPPPSRVTHPGGPQHPFPADHAAASAAGFMSLAHMLFQPKYPLGKKTFRCHQCRYLTDRKNNLKRHIATMHQDCGKFLECCDTIFRSKAALRDHVLLFHRTGYKCRFCGRNFCRKALLKRHLTVHNGQKDFICTVCDYATSHKSNLERHRKVHGLGSPYGSEDGEHVDGEGPDPRDLQEELQEVDFMTYHKEDGDEDEEDEDGDDEAEGSDEDNINPVDTTAPSSPASPSHDLSPLTPDDLPQDPLLLNPTPIITAHNSRKHTWNRKFCLPDRLRQTYENTDTDTINLHDTNNSKHSTDPEIIKPVDPSPTNTNPHHHTDHSTKERSPSKRPVSASIATDETPGSPRKQSRPRCTPREPFSHAPPASQAVGGYRRLYASPYKCSECGISLATQHKLLKHSMACRRPGVAPQRPINAIASDNNVMTAYGTRESGGQGRTLDMEPDTNGRGKSTEDSQPDHGTTNGSTRTDRCKSTEDSQPGHGVLGEECKTVSVNSPGVVDLRVRDEEDEDEENRRTSLSSSSPDQPRSSYSSRHRVQRLSPITKEDDGKLLPIKKRSLNHYNL